MPPKPKRTKTLCKKCTNVAQPGNFGFCEQHRTKKDRAGGSNDNTEPVITLVDTGEPNNDLFPPGAGTVLAPVPSAPQQNMLDQRLQDRRAANDEVRYNIMPNVPCIGSRSAHLSPTMRPSNVAQSIANIGPHRPNQNFVGRVHQALANNNMVVPAVNATAVLGNHLPGLQLPEEVPQPAAAAPDDDQAPAAAPPSAPRLSDREALLRSTTPAARHGDINSMWREGVADMPKPSLPNPNRKESRTPILQTTTTSSGNQRRSMPPSPKWYSSLPETTIRYAKLKVGNLFSALTLLPIINPMMHLPSHASGDIAPMYDASHPLQAVSITVCKLGGDVPVEWLALLGEYMSVFAVLGLIAVELGTTEMHLHLQAVMVMHMTGADQCIKLIVDHIKVWLDIIIMVMRRLSSASCEDATTKGTRSILHARLLHEGPSPCTLPLHCPESYEGNTSGRHISIQWCYDRFSKHQQ